MLLKNKNVILTGAGRGIGRVLAQQFAEEGASIALLSRTQRELEQTLSLIKRRSPGSFICPVDISIRTEVEEAFLQIRNRFPSIDVLVNNAGVQRPIGKFHENEIQLWIDNIGINLFGTLYLTHLVLPEMISRKKGKIIIMSGGGSTGPRPNFSAYAVAKTALVRFTENLASEYKEEGIDINAVAPGAINTGMLEEVLESETLSGSEYADALKRKKLGGNDPKVAAALITFLASELSDGITGKLLSAPWDPWREQAFRERLKTDKDLGTLRRIDDKYFIAKK